MDKFQTCDEHVLHHGLMAKRMVMPLSLILEGPRCKRDKKDWTAESVMIWRSSQPCLKIEPKSEFQMNLSVWRSVMSTGYILLLILSLSHPLSHLHLASDKWLQYFCPWYAVPLSIYKNTHLQIYYTINTEDKLLLGRKNTCRNTSGSCKRFSLSCLERTFHLKAIDLNIKYTVVGGLPLI